MLTPCLLRADHSRCQRVQLQTNTETHRLMRTMLKEAFIFADPFLGYAFSINAPVFFLSLGTLG